MLRTGARGRHAAILRELEIPVPFDLGQFVAGLERRRQRPIRLRPFTSEPGCPCGLWIGTADADSRLPHPEQRNEASERGGVETPTVHDPRLVVDDACTAHKTPKSGSRSHRGMCGKSIDRGARFTYGCADWPTWR